LRGIDQDRWAGWHARTHQPDGLIARKIRP